MQRLSQVALDPLLLVCAVLLLAFLFYWKTAHLRFTWRGFLLMLVPTAFILISSAPGIVNRLVDQVESRHSLESCSQEETPLIVMGGGIDHDARSPKDFASLHQPTLVRTIEAWRLVTEQPDAGYPVVLTGGGFRRTVSESSAMQQLLLSLGMDSSRLFIKETSIDTASNAVETSALFKEMGWSKKVRLVTSALHMVRAKATFERQGFEVCAIAEVDVQAIKGIPWYSLLPQTTSLLKFKKLLHELVGYLVYKVRGTVD